MRAPFSLKLKKTQMRSLSGLSQKKKLIFLNNGEFGLKSLESGFITENQIEAIRRIIIRLSSKYLKVWICIFPTIMITAKPKETRMGKGKGMPLYWISKVKAGRILIEIIGFDYLMSKFILNIAVKKLAIKCRVCQVIKN